MAIIDPFSGNCPGHYGHLHRFPETLWLWAAPTCIRRGTRAPTGAEAPRAKPPRRIVSLLCRFRRSYHLGYFFFAEFFFAFFAAGFFFAFLTAGFFSRRCADVSISISSNHSTRVLATRRNVSLRDGDRVAIPTCAAFLESSSPSEARAKNIFSMPPSMPVQLFTLPPSSTSHRCYKQWRRPRLLR